MSSPTTGPVVRVLLHDLGRTGVPVLLLRLLRWATIAHPGTQFDVVALHGGPLRGEIGARSRSVTVIEPTGRRSVGSAAAVALDIAGRSKAADTARRIHRRVRTLRLPPPDIVLVHGAGAWALRSAIPSAVPVVLHLQELDVALSRCVPLDELDAFLGSMSTVMVVSAAVERLAARHGVAVDRLVRVPGMIDPDAVVDVAAARRARRGSGAMVAAAGTPGWRKGTDRFVALAHGLSRSVPEAEAVWVGGRPTGAAATFVGAPDPVRWCESRPDPWQLLAAADLLVVPSREDPLPLVALEAAQHGLPVVAHRSGGVDDLLADGRGVLVDAGDPVGLHDAVVGLLRDPDTAGRLSAALAASADRYHPDRIGPSWWSAMTGES